MTFPKRITTVHSETLSNELCLYDWQRHQVHSLNRTAAQVWQLCDGDTSPAQMAQTLWPELPAAKAQALVWLALEDLAKAHLLVGPLPHRPPAGTFTRRRFITAVGLGAVAVLPAIHSLMAPSPVSAQSPLPNTATNTPTPSDTPTASDTPTDTPTSTITNTPSDTPTNTPTNTPSDTPTNTPTNTPSDTPTNTPTNTPVNTPTDTPTNTPTNTPTDTPTNTPTSTPTDTPTNTPTNTDIPVVAARVQPQTTPLPPQVAKN